MMLERKKNALIEPAEWLGEVHPLVEQLGSTEGLFELGATCATLHVRPVSDSISLREFLSRYREKLLLGIELPVVRHAFLHAQRNEVRELIALDANLRDQPAWKRFADASRRVGEAQLQRLRPLRDERIVQRYLAAVDAGNAEGWHTVVYGLTLAIYSLPLRPGLHTYAQNTLRGFVHAAARSLRLDEKQSNKLLDEICAPLHERIEKLLAAKPEN